MQYIQQNKSIILKKYMVHHRANNTGSSLWIFFQAASGSRHWQSLQNMVETFSPQQSPPSQLQSSVFRKSLQMESPIMKLKDPYQHGSDMYFEVLNLI